MAQTGIYDLLKNNKDKWYSTRDISKKLNIGIPSATVNIARILKNGNNIKIRYIKNHVQGREIRQIKWKGK